jgi:hypothetical protein
LWFQFNKSPVKWELVTSLCEQPEAQFDAIEADSARVVSKPMLRAALSPAMKKALV